MIVQIYDHLKYSYLCIMMTYTVNAIPNIYVQRFLRAKTKTL